MKFQNDKKFLIMCIAIIVAILLIAVSVGYARKHILFSNSNSFNEDSVPNPTLIRDLTHKDKLNVASKIISSFENSTTTIQYDYAENIGDGRGITAGRAGFTSGTGDMLLVIKEYTKRQPKNILAKYLASLRVIDDERSPGELNGTTKGLDGLITDWKAAAQDETFIQVQDALFKELYADPALLIAKEMGIKTTVGQLIILDTAVQHGLGEDPDGIKNIIKETGDLTQEFTWLEEFLKIRKQHLLNATDPSTRVAWSKSVSRVDALNEILHTGNYNLDSPLQWHIENTIYEI